MQRNNMRILGILALFILFLFFTADRIFELNGHRMDKTAMREMLGTFSNTTGKAGNYITFELTPSPIKTNSGIVQARSGDGHLHNLFGYEDMDFTWGYCEWTPKLIISIVNKADLKSPEPKNRLGQLQVTALGHSVLQLLPMPVEDHNQRLKDIFNKAEPMISVTRIKEPAYPPPKI